MKNRATKTPNKKAKVTKITKKQVKTKSNSRFLKKKKAKKSESLTQSQESEKKELLPQDVEAKKTANSESEAFIPFFYTNDKFMNQFEDKEILLEIQEKFPRFMREGSTDSEVKKTLSLMIQDREFLIEVMNKYDMKLQDFFKFIFRQESSIFKGSFIKKIQKLLKDGNYLN